MQLFHRKKFWIAVIGIVLIIGTITGLTVYQLQKPPRSSPDDFPIKGDVWGFYTFFTEDGVEGHFAQTSEMIVEATVLEVYKDFSQYFPIGGASGYENMHAVRVRSDKVLLGDVQNGQEIIMLGADPYYNRNVGERNIFCAVREEYFDYQGMPAYRASEMDQFYIAPDNRIYYTYSCFFPEEYNKGMKLSKFERRLKQYIRKYPEKVSSRVQ